MVAEPNIRVEWLKCSRSVSYWIDQYVQIFNATPGGQDGGDWVRFHLWPAQRAVLSSFLHHKLVAVLKARQLGLTWLAIAFALWSMLFRPASTVLLFSRRDEEAVDLLNRRLKGVYARLPDWMKAKGIVEDSQHTWILSNGSSARGFPTTGGRSYTSSLVIVDEADFIPDLDGLLNSVKPTVDAGGQLILISSVDKSAPQSPFKRIYRAAKSETSPWHGVFLPWFARPGRDESWYSAQRTDVLTRTGVLDDLFQEYPATDLEALAPRSLDKRIPASWVDACYQPLPSLTFPHLPALPGLFIYREPEPGRHYVMGVDPAEGNPTSDESAIVVLDLASGDEVATLAGRFQPSTIAAYADTLGTYYNNAAVMVERNNHGHAVLLWLRDNSRLTVLTGRDGKPGWMSSSLGKALLYNELADAFRDLQVTVRNFDTYLQLVSIEGSSLSAPPGEHDDRADAFALAQMGRALAVSQTSGLRQGVVPGRGGRRISRTVRRFA